MVGATEANIIQFLSKEFLSWVLLANIIAWPIAFFAMNKWLQNYAFRIELGIWVFLFSGVLAMIIALLTVSYQTINVAATNPIDILRYE